MKTIKRLAKYLHGYWKDTILTWTAVLIETVCEVLCTFFMQYLVNAVDKLDEGEIVRAQAMNDIYMYALIITALVLTAAVTGILAGYWASSAAAGFGKNLREAEFIHVQDYSFKNIDKFSTSSIVTRTTTDITNVQMALMMIIRMVFRAPFMMVFSLIMAFATYAQVAWIYLLLIPISLTILLVIAKSVHPIFQKVFDTYDELNESVQEEVAGIRVVKSFTREEYQTNKFKKTSEFIARNFIKAERRLAFNQPCLNAAVYTAILVVVYICSAAIVATKGDVNATISTGTLSTLVTYSMMIMMALMMVTMVYVMLMTGRTSAERILEALDEVPDIVSPENAIETVPNGEVIFNNVSFGYNEGKYVLEDINVNVPSGTMVGIIGSTGSSKSTMMSLIARLYDVNEGEVLVGGHNVKEYDLVALRDSVSVVLQKNVLFSGTIRENLSWGNENATEEEMMRACDAAQVTPFLEHLPNGLDTMLDEGGTNVSGGQKQRICIARALLKNPKILILDDSTSACDTHNDSLIREALQNGHKEITKFIIAQRILSVKDCDEIWVMHEGRIIVKGNHDELMESSQIYRELYESQLSGGDFDAAK